MNAERLLSTLARLAAFGVADAAEKKKDDKIVCVPGEDRSWNCGTPENPPQAKPPAETSSAPAPAAAESSAPAPEPPPFLMNPERQRRLSPEAHQRNAEVAAEAERRDREETARAEAARARLADLTIRAPFNGKLGLRRVSVGALVTSGTLITTLDDVIDIMKDAARRLGLYKVAYTPEMLGMADCAIRASTAIRDAMPALNAIGRNEAVFNEMQQKVRAAESEADDLLQRGMKALFAGSDPAGDKLIGERVYELIEAVVDRCEDVTDVIAGIVVEHV